MVAGTGNTLYEVLVQLVSCHELFEIGLGLAINA